MIFNAYLKSNPYLLQVNCRKWWTDPHRSDEIIAQKTLVLTGDLVVKKLGESSFKRLDIKINQEFEICFLSIF